MYFTINGVKWGIQFVTGADYRLMRSDGSMTLGVTDANDSMIYLSSALRGDLLEHVLCHELCHAVCFSWNIYMPIDQEEQLCNFMADHGKEIVFLLDDLLRNMTNKKFAY